MMEKILLTGAKGQLGQTFLLHFTRSDLTKKYTLIPSDRNDMDLTDNESIFSFLSLYKPSVIMNCGAYTAVDKAETECELAKKINDEAVGYISDWTSKNDCRLIHISTDFVFDGKKGAPYVPADTASPTGVYGQTKLAGEERILNSLTERAVIIRTSWLYSEFRQNFVKTMIRLMAEKPDLAVVNDQVGSPTSAHSLARVLIKTLEHQSFSGILHWCDGASISWFDFALEIQKLTSRHGLLKREVILKPLMTEDYPSLAKRPSYSVLDRSCALDHLELPATDWRVELEKVIERILKN